MEGRAIYEGSLGTYQRGKSLGKGGNGAVYEAEGPDGKVALKVLKQLRRPNSDAGPRFEREITTLQQIIDVQGVLPLIDHDPNFKSSDRPWFVMPIATLLSERLGDNSSLVQLCNAIAAIAGTLSVLHERGYSHRDIKPSNLYWYDDRWCIGDFGLVSKLDRSELTRESKKLGPAYYIAPEMLNDPVSADGQTADIYSLGKTLWVLATGQTYPYPGEHSPKHRQSSVASYVSEGPVEVVDELLARMTRLSPGDRPAASWVASELKLAGEVKAEPVFPNLEKSLQAVRAATTRHVTEEGERKRKQELAKRQYNRIRAAIQELAANVADQTDLSGDGWYEMPRAWDYHRTYSGPAVVREDEVGIAFEAGSGGYTYRLGIGTKCMLLSDDNLRVSAGFDLCPFVHGHNVREMRGGGPWSTQAKALIGSAECEAMVNLVIQGLQEHLGSELERFAAAVSALTR